MLSESNEEDFNEHARICSEYENTILRIRKSTNDLTGCSRGQHGTSASSHTSGARLDSVRWAIDQKQVSGNRIMDLAKDYQGTTLTIGDITNYPDRKNNITPPTEITLYKT